MTVASKIRSFPATPRKSRRNRYFPATARFRCSVAHDPSPEQPDAAERLSGVLEARPRARLPKALEVAVAEDHGLPAPETLDILAGERPADAEPAIDSHGGVDELERVGAFGLLDRCPDFRQACEEYELYAGEQHVNLAGRLRDVMSRVSSIIPALAARGLNISQLEDSLHKLDIARCDLRCAFSVVTTPATQNSYVFTLTTMPAPDEKDFRSWLSTTAIESDALAHDLSPYASERAILPLRHAAGVLRAVAKRLPK